MDEVTQALAGAKRVFVLTGAGMSAESGLPTFRGAGGYWNNLRFEDLASPQGFARNPQLVWQWYNERIRLYGGAQPNAGHFALAQMEALFERFTIATQNVDSLHQRAGSRDVVELHGNLREARCTRCEHRESIANGLPPERIAHACGGMLRPSVVWFGETLPEGAWERAAQTAFSADVVLVVGTSAQVYPAAALAFLNEKAYTAVIDPDPAAASAAYAHVKEPAAVALPRIAQALRVGR